LQGLDISGILTNAAGPPPHNWASLATACAIRVQLWQHAISAKRVGVRFFGPLLHSRLKAHRQIKRAAGQRHFGTPDTSSAGFTQQKSRI
jgi:hypothetical protein